MAVMQYFEPFPKNRGDELGNMASYRKHPHRGSDWGAKKGIEGEPVKAITNGRVKKIFWTDVLGWTVIQSSGDGINWQYSHLFPKPILEVGTALSWWSDLSGFVS